MRQKEHILSLLMGGANMSGSEKILLPEVMVIAEPNGSGKSILEQ